MSGLGELSDMRSFKIINGSPYWVNISIILDNSYWLELLWSTIRASSSCSSSDWLGVVCNSNSSCAFLAYSSLTDIDLTLLSIKAISSWEIFNLYSSTFCAKPNEQKINKTVINFKFFKALSPKRNIIFTLFICYMSDDNKFRII